MSYLEDKVEKRLGEGLAALFSEDRYFYFKFKPAGIIGVPDRILIVPGMIMFIELKKPDGKRAAWQVRLHEKLRRLGCWIETLYSLEEVEDFLAYLRKSYG